MITDSPRSVLEISQNAGITLRSDCGGIGVCGKCRIQIAKKYGSISPPTDKELKFLTAEEIAQNIRLACQVKILSGTATIYIPKESRNEAREISGTALEGRISLSPVIQKVQCQLPRPSLEDTLPDLERLTIGVGRIFNQIPLSILTNLPAILRAAEWNITAVFCNNDLIALESGNTTTEMYGVAIDIGSSKIICHLVDLLNGVTIAEEHAENPQIMYGEDVVSRITFAAKNPKNLKKIQSLVIDTINALIIKMSEKAGIEKDKIYEIVFDGNTVMHHLFLGINPKFIGVSPFLPGLKSQVSFPSRDLGLEILPEGKVTSLPLIAGYVGSDAVADLMLTRIYEKSEYSLLIDIGTNSEIMVGNSEKILVCSAPSGPSFEGAHISAGMKAVGGAIETISIEDGKLNYTTIGNRKPKGICGSGIIDLVAELFSAGIITKNGKFTDLSHPRIIKRVVPEFLVVPKEETDTDRDITITEKDINEFLLAKGSLRAGWTILLEKFGISQSEISRIWLAGSFGTHINIENAMSLELIPQVDPDLVVLAGETAVGGSKIALLSGSERESIKKILMKVKYVELSVEKSFNREYLRSIPIYHAISSNSIL
ncbi:ASKHA domain-containing protein [Methanospirillum lacunae]